jgi:hypothetical protein
VSPVKYELGFYIPKDDILHSHRREILRSYTKFCYFTITATTVILLLAAVLLASQKQKSKYIECSLYFMLAWQLHSEGITLCYSAQACKLQRNSEGDEFSILW